MSLENQYVSALAAETKDDKTKSLLKIWKRKSIHKDQAMPALSEDDDETKEEDGAAAQQRRRSSLAAVAPAPVNATRKSKLDPSEMSPLKDLGMVSPVKTPTG